MSKPRNPDIDFGFHATIPRMVRTSYKDIAPLQKWLYVCLKDLCGEHGTCYRTVKVLAEETGLSTGLVSESIRALHNAGLIHAEKKKRSTGGKEVWHITIVDIWQANGKAHPTKRSLSEQTSRNVHSVNENVHQMNDTGEERSPDEPERSLSETEEGSSEAGSFFEAGSSEDSASAPPPTRQEHEELFEEATGTLQEVKRVTKAQRSKEIKALYAELLGFEPVWNRDEADGLKQLSQSPVATDEAIRATYQKYKKDKFWGPQLTLKVIAKFLNATVGNARPVQKKPIVRPSVEDIDKTIFCVDARWRVYQRQGDDTEYILWEGELLTRDEADERGYDGGFGLYVQTDYSKIGV